MYLNGIYLLNGNAAFMCVRDSKPIDHYSCRAVFIEIISNIIFHTFYWFACDSRVLKPIMYKILVRKEKHSKVRGAVKAASGHAGRRQGAPSSTIASL